MTQTKQFILKRGSIVFFSLATIATILFIKGALSDDKVIASMGCEILFLSFSFGIDFRRHSREWEDKIGIIGGIAGFLLFILVQFAVVTCESVIMTEIGSSNIAQLIGLILTAYFSIKMHKLALKHNDKIM